MLTTDVMTGHRDTAVYRSGQSMLKTGFTSIRISITPRDLARLTGLGVRSPSGVDMCGRMRMISPPNTAMSLLEVATL